MHTTFLNKNGFGTTSTFPTSADQSCHLFQTLPIQGKHGKHGTIPVMFIYPKSGRSRHLSTFHISHGSICLKPLAVPQPNAKTPMLFLGKAMKSRMVVCWVPHSSGSNNNVEIQNQEKWWHCQEHHAQFTSKKYNWNLEPKMYNKTKSNLSCSHQQ